MSRVNKLKKKTTTKKSEMGFCWTIIRSKVACTECRFFVLRAAAAAQELMLLIGEVGSWARSHFLFSSVCFEGSSQASPPGFASKTENLWESNFFRRKKKN